MSNYTLTRFLYSQDEVIFSFITSLLKKDNLSESYYWAYELYYSGFDMPALFWKIHFDYYAERNPKFEGYMNMRMDALKQDNDMKHIAYIVRNMFRLTPTSTTFILRQFLASGGVPSCIYRGRRPAWLQDYDKPYRNLLLSLSKENLRNAAYHIQTLLKTTPSVDLYPMLLKYYSTCNDAISMKRIDQRWKTRTHCDDFHCLISLIVHMAAPKSDVNVRGIFIVPSEADIAASLQIADESIPEGRAYKTFRKKRLYSVRNWIGSFPLVRFEFEDYKKETLLYWEYYTIRTPLWKARLDRHSGVIDHDNKKIAFPSEDDEDAFYEKYAFDFDEQPRDIQDMSLIDIERKDWSTWYYSVFENAPIVELPTGFSYQY